MKIIFLETVESTNTSLRELSKKGAKSWTVLWSNNQIKGKGYAGNNWLSEKKKNIACSILIRSNLTHSELIFLNQWVSNEICKFVSELTSEVFVKWPNDIILNNKKVCGILIESYHVENELNIIIGFGLNVNQTDFGKLTHATSLKSETGKDYLLEEIMSALLTKMRENYFLVENKSWEEISNSYNDRLFRKGIESKFIINGQMISGEILRVNENGSLKVKFDNNDIKAFIHKQIELIY